jgi:hypothetical protein
MKRRLRNKRNKQNRRKISTIDEARIIQGSPIGHIPANVWLKFFVRFVYFVCFVIFLFPRKQQRLPALVLTACSLFCWGEDPIRTIVQLKKLVEPPDFKWEKS